MKISTNSNINKSNHLTENEIKSLNYVIYGGQDRSNYPVIEDSLGELPLDFFKTA